MVDEGRAPINHGARRGLRLETYFAVGTRLKQTSAASAASAAKISAE